MYLSPDSQVFGFVWRPREISRAVVDLARRTSAAAIFDLSAGRPVPLAAALRSAGAAEALISAHDLMDPELGLFLKDSGIKTLWVEYHPHLFPGSPEAFLARLAGLAERCACVPVTGDLGLLELIISRDGPPGVVALKGNEAAGLVGNETLSVLFSGLRQKLERGNRGPDLILWGGIATAEAAAAYLATGARGIVFESLHWLTDLVATDHEVRELLAKLRPEHTRTVGAPLGVSYRFFDKGNAPKVREMELAAHFLVDTAGIEDGGREFARQVAAAAVPALEGGLDRQRLIPLGPEAAFAQAFVERYGRASTEAIQGFLAEVTGLVPQAPAVAGRFLMSPAVRELGVKYPFIQGAMTWISDVPEFARAVAEAGGLPTVALGLRDRRQLENDFNRLPSVMGSRPYAVNIIALAENPYLEAQLAWIEAVRPPFVAIAAGDPAYAVGLRRQGIEVIYITADLGLLRLALEGGVRWVVLEGNEAGGHVGAHSSLTLTQMALELKRREPELFRDGRLVLAGGICDRESALRAAMMGADAIQLGTAYLATKEIVDTGALSRLYQRLILEAAPGMTTLSGESIGLRVRSLKTAKMEAIVGLERKYLAGQRDESAFRRQLEALSARSLLIAARGQVDAGGSLLDEETCLKEGQFMSGAVAGMLDRVVTVADLHRELAAGPLPAALPKAPPGKAKARRGRHKRGNGRERVAITGIALVNSLGNTPDEVWERVLALQSGIIEVPPSRWDHSVFYDSRPGTKEKTYCKVGAFQNLSISRKELGIPPQDFRTMSNSTKLTLHLAGQAIKDADIVGSDLPRERIGIVISQNSGESASTLGDLVIGVSAKKIVQSLHGLLPLTPELEQEAERRIKAGCMTVDDTTLLGRLNSTAGGFISNKFGFMGPCYSVSAACATSLVAIFTAIQMIHNGVIDAAVVGGGEENLYPAHFIEFAALGALAGVSGLQCPPQESSRPFDSTRDGFVLGEGGGMIVIERESVAKKRGAQIYAYLTGVGASNNDRGMVESVAETQKIAIRSGFEDAGYGPEMVDLIECHATGTMQGDVEEVKALKNFYHNGRRIILTSFKSQIGHSLGASGISSLIRGLMALRSGIFPPTLNYRRPDPEIDLERYGFQVLPQPEGWPRIENRPRRLQINAFGFGGANFVVHVEESRNGAGVVLVSEATQGGVRLEEREEPSPLEGVSCLRTTLDGCNYRLGVVAAGKGEATTKVAALEPLSAPLTEKSLRVLAGQGIFAASEDESPSPLALVFAGQGTFYPGMGRELYETFPLVRQWMDRMAALADFNLLERVFYSQEEDLQKTRWQQPALFALEYGIVRLLLSLGLKPAALAGHSMGEITALCVAGVLSVQDGYRLINKRAQCMDKAAGLSLDPGAMIAVDAPLPELTGKLARYPNVHFTNYNSPRQLVLGGSTEEVAALKEEFDREGRWNTLLRVSMAFHSPIMRVIREELEEFVAGIEMYPPLIPVISNTTKQPYPDDPVEIRKIIMAHLESPVHWQQNVETLWHDYGIQTFVEVGPKNTLCNLIADTFEQARCIPTSNPEMEAYTFRAAAAQLYAQGYLTLADPVEFVAFPSVAPPPAPGPVPPGPPAQGVAAVARREMDTFILDTFGKFLKPAILEAIRREVDPTFSEEQLGQLLASGLAGGQTAPAPGSVSPVMAAIPGLLPSGAATPPPAEKLIPEGDYVERVIGMIIEATGYERDEIEPYMDIRQDLAIRSSRLPVIMDLAERHFGISVKLEDFINVRTVQQIADRIAEVVERDGVQRPAELQGSEVASVVAGEEEDALSETKPIKRLVFREAPLGPVSDILLNLPPGRQVAVVSLTPESELAAFLGNHLRQELDVQPLFLTATGDHELRTSQGAAALARRLAAAESLAGLVLVLDQGAEAALENLEEVPALLTGIFGAVQTLMRSPDRKFCLLMTQIAAGGSPAAIAAEGALGMFLAAALEYDSVLFRSVALDRSTDPGAALKRALNLDHHLTEILYRDQDAYTVEPRVEPLTSAYEPDFRLPPESVVVISGGAKGVTPHLAYALAPFQPRLILLGSSVLDPETDYESLLDAASPEEASQDRLGRHRPEDPKELREAAVAELRSGLEITKTLRELARQGLEATYFACDVNEGESVARVLDQVVQRYGAIDGIMHGAGIIRDSFLEFMSAADFAKVVEVKLLGAWNLYRAARDRGLRFLVMLSSITAVRGNVGQVNYCAGNRAMAALVRYIADDEPLVRAKALMLPPIADAGMADSPELRELMRLRGMDEAYISVGELAELFCRELFLGPPQESWVMPIRSLPDLKTVRLHLEERPPGKGFTTRGGVAYGDDEVPMIGEVQRLEIGKGTLLAGRSFSLERDLWLEDHRPYKFLKNPFVSGIMAVETLLEAAHVLYPHLTTLGLRRVEYRDILECPPGVERETQILCRRAPESQGREVLCDLVISSPDITATGRILDRRSTNYIGQVILGAPGGPLPEWPDFTVTSAELDTAPLNQHEVQRFYRKYSNLQGRYQLVERIDGTGQGVVRGRMIYQQSDDFAGLRGARYQYSPYLLEGLKHLVNSYMMLRDESVTTIMIPFAIGEMRFARRCRVGEPLILEGRLRSQDNGGSTWDARALDAGGKIIMVVESLVLKAFSA